MLTLEEVKHIARLARLELNNKELKQYSLELSKILGYVDQLQTVDTDSMTVNVNISGPINIWRPDKAKVWDKEELKLALKQVKNRDSNNQVKVGRVLE